MLQQDTVESDFYLLRTISKWDTNLCKVCLAYNISVQSTAGYLSIRSLSPVCVFLQPTSQCKTVTDIRKRSDEIWNGLWKRHHAHEFVICSNLDSPVILKALRLHFSHLKSNKSNSKISNFIDSYYSCLST